MATEYSDRGVHPSLPNYLVATSGDRQGIADDGAPDAHPLTVDNIFRQVRMRGGTAMSYQESMPGNCALRSTASYAVKHNPAAYYIGEDDRAACLRDDVPFEQFTHDLTSGLPTFALITPNLCHDMHDCGIDVGDAWLQDTVTEILDSPDYRAGHTVVLVMWDESVRGGTTMPFLVVAPSVVAGTRTDTTLDHLATLAFTEHVLGIDRPLAGAAKAPDLAGAFGL
jgi:acid phosphatase